MKRWGIFLGAVLCCVSQLYAFDFSNTQSVNISKKTQPRQISSDFIENLICDESLCKGLDSFMVSEDGTANHSICGELSEPLKGDLENATKEFIFDHASLFNIPDKKNKNLLRLIKKEEAACGHHFVFQMVVENIPVQDGFIDIHVGKDRRVQLANGCCPQVKEIANKISIGRIEALAAAQRAIGAKKVIGIPKAELVIVPLNSKGFVAFSVKISSKSPLGDWLVFIDADTGREISRQNEMLFSDRATGKGSVYVSHPLNSSVTNESLPHLKAHTLDGEFASVKNEDGEGSVSENDTHVYDPENTHFDEVNIYFHVNKIHDFFKSLGFSKLDSPMKATVHVGDKYDNAYFSPWENAMSFGDGNKLNDLSKEESVCYHEYSHAMVNQIVRLSGPEGGAMNEGQADYFACTYTNDSKLGEYVVAKMNKPFMRNLDNTTHYPEDIQNEVHADGKIWGAALWDLRSALGASISNKLVYNAYFYLKTSRQKFVDGLNSIVAADKNLFGEKYKNTILEVFQKRGISLS
ncbi:M36 family metallopeptidase, partial [bacterium]|nr:M36 family metallopeptidase [bacterium]